MIWWFDNLIIWWFDDFSASGSVSIAGESSMSAGRSSALAGGSSMIACQSSALAGGSSISAGRSSALAGGSSMGAGRSSAIAGGSFAIAGGSCMGTGRNSAIAGWSFALAGGSYLCTFLLVQKSTPPSAGRRQSTPTNDYCLPPWRDRLVPWCGFCTTVNWAFVILHDFLLNMLECQRSQVLKTWLLSAKQNKNTNFRTCIST